MTEDDISPKSPRLTTEPSQMNDSNVTAKAAKSNNWRALLSALGALVLLGVSLAWLLTRAESEKRPEQVSTSTAETSAPELEALSKRLHDSEQVNRVLREQALALDQRLNLLEQSIASLRREGAPSTESFKLDEAQYLLGLAQTRLELFADPENAGRALELADGLIENLGDPRLASVRQTLAIEIDVVRAAPMNDLPMLSGKLRGLSDDLAELRVRPENAMAADGSRLWAALDRYLVVRREGEAVPALGRSAWVVREGIKIEIERAQLALERQQAERWSDALNTAVKMAEQSLLTDDANVDAFLRRLRALAATNLAPEPPKIGAALRELRRMRATTAINESVQEPIPSAAPERDRVAEPDPVRPMEQTPEEQQTPEELTPEAPAPELDVPVQPTVPADAPNALEPVGP